MVEMELSVIFGAKSKTVVTGNADPTTGVGLPVYTFDGIIAFLNNWEAQYSIYRVVMELPLALRRLLLILTTTSVSS